MTSKFSETIFNQKYAHIRKDGKLETWEEMSKRVSSNVLKSVDAKKSLIREVQQIIAEKKFIPGDLIIETRDKSNRWVFSDKGEHFNKDVKSLLDS